MATTKVVSANAIRGNDGSRKTFPGRDGKTMYPFWYVMENGMAGEAAHELDNPRFPVGSEVDAEVTTTNPQYPKLKVGKVGGFQGGGGGKGWSPEKELDVKLQGFIKSAYEGGAKSVPEMTMAVKNMLSAHGALMAELKPAAQPAAQQVQQPMQSPMHQSGGMATTGQGLPYNPNGMPGGQPVYHGGQGMPGGQGAFPDNGGY